jgi:acyl carrier protein
MLKLEFMAELADALKIDVSELKGELALGEMSGWDSTGMISVIALLNEAGVKVKAAKLREVKTVGDIIAMAGDELEG